MKISKYLQILVVSMLILCAIGAATSHQVARAKAMPQLLEMAAKDPGQVVRVIAQKMAGAQAVEELVAQLGGKVLTDLSIINAFSAEMTADAAINLSRSEGVRWVSLDSKMESSSDEEISFMTWATSIGSAVENKFINPENMVDPSGFGPDGAFGYQYGNAKGSYSGFNIESIPGYAITKVEAAIYIYVNESINKNYIFKTYVNNTKTGAVKVSTDDLFSDVVGLNNAGVVYVDITSCKKNWQWIDLFNNFELYIEQKGFAASNMVNYDAVGLRVTSVPGTDNSLDGFFDPIPATDIFIDPYDQVNVYNDVIGASQLWNTNNRLQGKGIGVAVVDSGIAKLIDLQIKNSVNFNKTFHDSPDRYGHGTFVAGIIAGSGKSSDGKYIGVAPNSTLFNVRVSDDNGISYTSDVIEALQWVYDNREVNEIRVVNLSLTQSVPESYHISPLDAAVEVLWFNSIVVVVSAGNNGKGVLYPPANDPFVITVGATDDGNTVEKTDDIVTTFSSFGITEDGFSKPDLVAPGRHIIGLLPNNDKTLMGMGHPQNQIDTTYIKMSGTSISAPMVSGAVAILLQDEPNLTPDQVKYRLMATANSNWSGYDALSAGAGYLDIFSAVYGNSTLSANQGIIPSHLLSTGSEAIDFDSVGWNSVGWNSVGWNSVGWTSVGWNSVGWTSVGWNSVGWNSVGWNSVGWNSVGWNSVGWFNDYWDQ